MTTSPAPEISRYGGTVGRGRLGQLGFHVGLGLGLCRDVQGGVLDTDPIDRHVQAGQPGQPDVEDDDGEAGALAPVG
jgi:hypothetical protein